MNSTNIKLPKWSIIAGVVTVMLGTCFSALALIAGINQQESITNPAQTGTISFVSSNGNVYSLNVELATTPTQLQTGLMNRYYLDNNQGMLFVFSSTELRTFWMKDTYIPLDMVFLDAQGRVVTIHQGTTPNQTNQLYSSTSPAKYVLETNAGWVARSGLQVGDYLSLNI